MNASLPKLPIYINYLKTTCIGLRLSQIMEKVHIDYPFLPMYCPETFKNTDKGSMGKLVEKYLFGIEPNNDPRPDLGDIDIKCTKFKKLKNGHFNAKERLTITNCGNTNNYSSFKEIADNEKLSETKYFSKINKGLLFVFENKTNILLSIVQYQLTDLPNLYLEQINEDYTTIHNLVKTQGVTQKGQKYLHIHPHGSGHGSGNRAFGFTNRFLTYIVAYYISLENNKPLEEVLLSKGNSYFINKNFLK